MCKEKTFLLFYVMMPQLEVVGGLGPLLLAAEEVAPAAVQEAEAGVPVAASGASSATLEMPA